MAVLGLLELAISAVNEGLKLANTEVSRKYLNKATELQLKLKSLLEQPYDAQDDVQIVSVQKELAIWFEGAQDALKLSQSNG